MMFEKEIKFIGDFSFNQVRSLGSNFTLDKIVNAGVHPAIVQYISAELDFMIYSDRRKLLQQSYFDYAGKEISDHFQKISDEIKKHKKISLEDSKKLIFQAVSFNINYLVRPRWSLMKLIFNDQPVISVEEMRMLLNYLYYYEYFKKVLIGYISKRNLVQISSTEFDILLNKIDNELLNSDQRQVVSNSFISMGDFYNIGGLEKNRIPLSAVEIFCKEKNLVDLLMKMKKAIPNEVKRRYDIVEIERMLFAPGLKTLTESETDLEDESKTEKMIEALDSDEQNPQIMEEEKNFDVQEEKVESETFLSPEEEEALLSLYSEDNKHTTGDDGDETNTSDIDLNSNKFDGLEVEGVKSALDMNLNTNLESEIDEDITDEETEIVEFSETEEQNSNPIYEEDSEMMISEEIISNDEELDEIVEAISDDLSSDENNIEEEIMVDNVESNESEVEIEQIDEPIETGIENEIVQDMLNDYYGEENQNETEQESNNLLEEEPIEAELDSTEEKADEKISSLEDELLNIFEDLDKEEFKFPEKERFNVSDGDESVEHEIKEEKAEETFSSETTDSFDEYLKSIDEIVFTDKPKNVAEVREPAKVETISENSSLQREIKAKFEEKPAEKEIEVEEPLEEITPSVVKSDKKQDSTRNLRPKDLFSYLKRKEVKKIVSYIFANDEEDFTNTAERIMDGGSYKEASDILKAVFTSYKISPYSKEAITFTNAVSNYFRQA